MNAFRLLMLLVALVGPTLLAWIYFVAMAPDPVKNEPAGPLALTLYGLSKAAQFSLPVAWVWMVERKPFQRLQWKSDGLVPGIGFGLGVIALTLGVYYGFLKGSSTLHETPAKVAEKIAAFHIGTPERYLLMSLFLAGIHSLLEEYYWRWFVFGQLRELLPAWPAISLASIGFMLHHVVVLAIYFPGRFWTSALPFSLAVAIGGAYWCWLYNRSQNIIACWISHLLADLAIMAVGYDMIFGHA